MRTFCPEGHLINIKSSKLLNQDSILSAIKTQEIFEGKVVMCDNNYNLIVDLGIIKGIIPKNEGAIGIKEGITKDIALISRVGKQVSFVIQDIINKDGKKHLLLSRKKAQIKCINYIKENLPLGSIIDAKVTHLESFGAFCDIGCGVIALLPIDSISVSRISHPKDRFNVGDNIKAIIKGIDENNRFTLSHKELLGTWEENAKNFKAGQTVSGIVRSIEEYGVFIELAPNLAGLAEPKQGVAIGQMASVYIKSIIPDKMKIKLIIIDSFLSEPNKNFTYYYQENFIKNWQYSPKISTKQVITIF